MLLGSQMSERGTNASQRSAYSLKLRCFIIIAPGDRFTKIMSKYPFPCYPGLNFNDTPVTMSAGQAGYGVDSFQVFSIKVEFKVQNQV